jgi:hypothetical protein
VATVGPWDPDVPVPPGKLNHRGVFGHHLGEQFVADLATSATPGSVVDPPQSVHECGIMWIGHRRRTYSRSNIAA